MAKRKEPEVVIGRTPAGALATETPNAVLPKFTTGWGALLSFLGEPQSRYGALYSGTGDVSISIKLQMLRDPTIAFALAYTASKLVKAEYEIRCKDLMIKRFFETMYTALHRDLMLQASMAIAIGYQGLIKRFSFQVPMGDDPTQDPPWSSSAVPLILTGFEQVDPVGSYPLFDTTTGKFTGFEHSQGRVDRVYALWITMGRYKAFGRYSGYGRLRNAYKAWWLGEFSDDQYVVHMQKSIDRVVEVSHPEGKDGDGNDLGDIALKIGDQVRAGATVAIPSTVYTFTDPLTNQQQATNARQWALRFLEGTENVSAFIENADHFAARKALGFLVPRQIYESVKQDALGGPTTSDVLGKVAVDLMLLEAAELDQHINEYVFPYLLSANFGPDAPVVRKVTIGLNEADRGEYFSLMQELVRSASTDTARRVDADGLGHSLGIPMLEEAAPDQTPQPPQPVVPQPSGQPDEQPPADQEPVDDEQAQVLKDHPQWVLGVLEGAITVNPADWHGHTFSEVQERCPICKNPLAYRFADHGGLCVCAACGVTFDPELE
jgi:hypothetical protein